MDNQEQLLPLLDMVVVVVENGNSLSGSVEMARMAHNYYFTCPNNNTNAGSNQTLAVCATTTLVQIHLHMETVHGRSFQVQTISNPTSTSGVTGLTIGTTATLMDYIKCCMWQYILGHDTKLVEKAVYPIVHLRLVMDINKTILTLL
jgi:hypothetical protein